MGSENRRDRTILVLLILIGRPAKQSAMEEVTVTAVAVTAVAVTAAVVTAVAVTAAVVTAVAVTAAVVTAAAVTAAVVTVAETAVEELCHRRESWERPARAVAAAEPDRV
jgi:hypothetical protein